MFYRNDAAVIDAAVINAAVVDTAVVDAAVERAILLSPKPSLWETESIGFTSLIMMSRTMASAAKWRRALQHDR